jgi:hypothetical protein
MAHLEKRDITRVNLNLPTRIVIQIREYANELGLPITQAYTVLLNQALEQKDMLKNMPQILNSVTDLNNLASKLTSLSDKANN